MISQVLKETIDDLLGWEVHEVANRSGTSQIIAQALEWLYRMGDYMHQRAASLVTRLREEVVEHMAFRGVLVKLHGSIDHQVPRGCLPQMVALPRTFTYPAFRRDTNPCLDLVSTTVRWLA